jgi:8-oxo-dGTP pyrophosphatase MutT (NUDIX family)
MGWRGFKGWRVMMGAIAAGGAGGGGIAGHLARAGALVLERRVAEGVYLRLRLGGAAVGFVRAAHARMLGWPVEGGALVAADAGVLAAGQQVLADAGVFALRGEDFDVRASGEADAPGLAVSEAAGDRRGLGGPVLGGPVLARVDRGALPIFGIEAQGVHVNGLVRGAGGSDGVRLWIGRRSRSKALDAGKLDHLVAGGIAAGMDAMGTLVKEADEEASVKAEVARGARYVGTLRYAVERAEGLRRDRLHCYDLDVPAGFRPVPRDGEVESFALMGVDEVLAGVRDTDDYKFNVNLVLIDLFARLGMIEAGPALLGLREG